MVFVIYRASLPKAWVSMPDWDQEFERIVQELQSNKPELEINRVIWRLNEVSMYLSRLIQYRTLGVAIPLGEELTDALPALGIIAAQVGRYLQNQEMDLVESAIEDEEEFCIECLENTKLDYWNDHEPEEVEGE